MKVLIVIALIAVVIGTPFGLSYVNPDKWAWSLATWIYGGVCMFLGAWWRANFADEPLPYEPYEEIPADDTYGRTARHLMEGK
jgi:hypothetical protein